MWLAAADVALWFLYGAFWIAAACGKLAEVPQFAIAILAYDIVPQAWVDPFAYAVIATELVAGALLFARRTRALASALAVLLLAVFTTAATAALLEGKFHECGCKLPLLQATTVGPHLLLRNLFLAAWGSLLLYRNSGARSAQDTGRALLALWEERWRIALAALVLMLVVSNVHQRGLIAKIRREGSDVKSEPLEEGMRLPDFNGVQVGSPEKKVRIAFGAGEPARVLILFSPACDVCARSTPDWAQAWKTRKVDVEFLGVSAGDSESTRRFAEYHKIPFPVLSVYPEVWKRLKTATVPKIVRLSPEGIVQKVLRKL